MVIDIIYIVALLIAIIIGIRQGLLTQIFMLIALVTTALVAPTVAAPLGLMFTDNELLAFTAGFGIMLLGAVVLVWLVAPLLKRLIIGKTLSRINSFLGACIAFATTILLLGVASTIFNTANIGDPDTDKIEAYVNECSNGQSEEELREGIDNLGDILNKRASMREFFKPRYVEYETLDESVLFEYFMWVGDNICPEIEELQNIAAVEVEELVKENFTQSIESDGTAE
jgi:uncharacterized membrane protein required for colicin V production